MQISISFNVAELPDAQPWFLNSAAWSNYWALVVATGTLDTINTVLYVPSPYDNGLNPVTFTVDEVEYTVPTIDQFNSLKAELAALDQSYQDLRTVLRNAGLIDNAQ